MVVVAVVGDHDSGCSGGHDNCDRNDHDSGISHGDDRFEIFKDVINYIFNIFDFLVNVMEILWLNEVLIWI